MGLVVVSLLSSVAHSATVYVSDIQFVAAREGLDNSSRATERGLRSGTPLEVLEKRDGYTKVQTPNGNEGWIADYFLSNDTVTRSQLNDLQSRLTSITESRAKIASQLKDNQQQLQEINGKYSQLQDENDDLKQKLESMENISEEAKAVVARGNEVNYQIASLKQQAEAANLIAKKATNSEIQKWFMIGAGTLLSGLFLGFILPNLRRRKPGTGAWS